MNIFSPRRKGADKKGSWQMLSRITGFPIKIGMLQIGQ
jgi:hypothetical protein